MKYIIEFKDERISMWRRSMLWDKQYEAAERDSILHGVGSTWRSVPAVDTSLDTASQPNTQGDQMTKAISKRTRRAARKAFPKAKHSTRPFTLADYNALPNIPNRPATK